MTLKEKALKTVEIDLKHYKEAVDNLRYWSEKECRCAESEEYPHLRWCAKCAWIDTSNKTMNDIEKKYKSVFI